MLKYGYYYKNKGELRRILDLAKKRGLYMTQALYEDAIEYDVEPGHDLEEYNKVIYDANHAVEIKAEDQHAEFKYIKVKKQ